jgi:hypothetical protein
VAQRRACDAGNLRLVVVGAPGLSIPEAASPKLVTQKAKKQRRSVKAEAPVELVVRRGALRRFHQLKEKTAALPVKVLWDRRQSDRRVASTEQNREQRKGERRQAAPYTWNVADFVVVARPRKVSSKKVK